MADFVHVYLFQFRAKVSVILILLWWVHEPMGTGREPVGGYTYVYTRVTTDQENELLTTSTTDKFVYVRTVLLIVPSTGTHAPYYGEKVWVMRHKYEKVLVMRYKHEMVLVIERHNTMFIGYNFLIYKMLHYLLDKGNCFEYNVHRLCKHRQY